MLIWILFAVLTAATVFFVLRPLTSEHVAAGQSDSAANISVYRAQLSELEDDVKRGAIGADEAEAARIEISRKLLQSVDNAKLKQEQPVGVGATPTSPNTSKILSVCLAAFIPLAAVLIYAGTGAPSLPDLPHAPRLKQSLKSTTADGLVARVEARLREVPDDGKGWAVIAPIYFRTGRFVDAADAYRKTIQLLGETPDRLIGYVKSAVLANNGIITEELRQIAERLTKMAPERAAPKFWLGLAKEQDGDLNGAEKAYKDLLATATEQDPWRKMVADRLEGLKTKKPE